MAVPHLLGHSVQMRLEDDLELFLYFFGVAQIQVVVLRHEKCDLFCEFEQPVNQADHPFYCVNELFVLFEHLGRLDALSLGHHDFLQTLLELRAVALQLTQNKPNFALSVVLLESVLQYELAHGCEPVMYILSPFPEMRDEALHENVRHLAVSSPAQKLPIGPPVPD